MSAEFPYPRDKLALIDLDGTLIDESYNITDEGIYDAIARTQQAGWQVGLSSDTPYEALTIWRERFGMNGPIVAEKGAVVEVNRKPIYDSLTAAAFKAARLDIESMLQQNGVRVWSGNPVEAMRDKSLLGTSNESVVLMNALRTCSLSFFVRRANKDSELVIEDRLTDRIVERARALYPDFDDLAEEVNPDYGIVIASRSQNTKRNGTQQLMAALGVKQVAMIGNSMGDHLGSDIAVHYAVGDATQEFKAQAQYASDRPVTSGVVEILGYLAEL